MTHRIVIIALSLTFFVGTCFAQNSKYKWGLGLHPSTFSFYAGFDSTFIDLGEYEHGVQFSINRYMGKLLDVGVEGSTAILRHPAGENNPANGGLWRDFFYNANPFVKIKANGLILKEKSFIMPFLKAGIGINKYKTAELGISAPLGAGLGFRFKDAGYLVVQSSYNLGVSNSEDYLHHSLGFVINLRGGQYKKKSQDQTDKDKDGIPDFRDECPEITAKNSKTGCPDMDEDGVKDSDDLCPRKKGLVNLSGCLDQDKDGVPDPLDKCPNKFGAQANNGCPETPQDSDNDLIEDELDKCPKLPGHWTGKGCPDQDGDGIVDKEDNCPNLFGESKFGGCPFDEQGMKDLNEGFSPNGATIFIEEGVSTTTSTIITTPTKPAKPTVEIGPEIKPTKKPVIINQPQETIVEEVKTTVTNTAVPCNLPEGLLQSAGQSIRFETNKATLTPDSKLLLNKVSSLLKPCPANLNIRAHTDSDGDDEYNLRLSERRAQAVSRYLIEQGMDRKYIKTSGAGETEPVASNDTIEGKSLNRRVELTVTPR